MSKSIRKFLKDASYNGRSKYEFEICGEIAESAIGKIQLVKVKGQSMPWILKTLDLHEQNFYAMVQNLSVKKKTLRGSDISHLLFTSGSRTECRTWARTYYKQTKTRLAKVAWISKDLEFERDSAKTLLLCNEFLNEACVGKLVSSLNVPHVVKTYDAWINDGHGHILMDYGGMPLMRSMVDFSLQEMQSVVLQSLIFIAIGQTQFHLKHHDMHLDNIFINRVKEESHNGTPLKSKPIWSYKLAEDLVVYVPHQNILTKIGDFGLASITEMESKTRFERVDYNHLDSGEVEWGAWNGKLNGQKSYDIVTLLTKFFLEEELEMLPSSCTQWLHQLYQTLEDLDHNICASLIGRPLRDQEGNISCIEFFQKSPLLKPFLKVPDDMSLVLPILN